MRAFLDNTPLANGIIGAFTNHRIAPNLLMLMMICSGFFIIDRLETRFFPKFSTQTIVVKTTWEGASAEDVGDSLLTPLENELRNVPNLKKMTSTAHDGIGLVYLEFQDGVTEDKASDDVQRYLDIAEANLPANSDAPNTEVAEFPDEILRLSLTGDRLEELRPLARRLEAELLRLDGIRVNVSGLPKNKIEIRLNRRRLAELNLSLADIGAQISNQNIDISAGDITTGNGDSRLLRALSKNKAINNLANLPILDGNNDFIRLADIADITRKPLDGEPTIFFNQKPAVQFDITRAADGDTLDGAYTVLQWMAEKRKALPYGVELHAHKQEWKIVDSRLRLLVDNGLQGLLLVLLLLFLMLHWRLAIWVAAGIPAIFMVSLCVLYFLGGTLDVLTMFAFIMTTGIVVDDSIVVSENTLYHRQNGKPPDSAAVDGAREMLPAVFASTFTTIASFMPIMIVGGPIGSILFAIPLVVVCVLFSALFECFMVLPGHLKAGLARILPASENPGNTRPSLLNRFQEGAFRRLVTLALRYRWVTIVSSFVLLALSISLFIGGFVKYRFFPGSELNRIFVQATFVAGTPKITVQEFMQNTTAALHETIAEFPEEDNLVHHTSLYMGEGLALDGVTRPVNGDELASMVVELKESDNRKTPANDIIYAWRKRIPHTAGLEHLSIVEESAGPPGEDINIRLSGDDLGMLKAAAESLKTALLDIPGVDNPKDDMPYGKTQIIFELTSLGRSLNLSVGEIARQLRDAFNGYKVQTLYEGVDETEIHTVLDGDGSPEDFAAFKVTLPNGASAALLDVVQIKSQHGFDSILRINTQPSVHVIGDVNFAITDANTALTQVETDILPPILEKYGVSYSFAGSRADEEQTVADMKTGLQIAFFAIFIILAGVFASWTLPIIIILTAPLGIIGSIFGHWIMGYEMSILSMFGIFTLNGIVINDSIILVRDYLARKTSATQDDDALITDSVCRRFRAILLTSLTTIGGLTPLMFETSTQAQFLIPMAISICFGLGFATLLILFVMPAYLSVHCSVGKLKARLLSNTTPAEQNL